MMTKNKYDEHVEVQGDDAATDTQPINDNNLIQEIIVIFAPS